MLLVEMTVGEILMNVDYWWTAAANGVLSAPISLLLVALSGSAECSKPGSHRVYNQTRAAGECVCHTAVSR